MSVTREERLIGAIAGDVLDLVRLSDAAMTMITARSDLSGLNRELIREVTAEIQALAAKFTDGLNQQRLEESP